MKTRSTAKVVSTRASAISPLNNNPYHSHISRPCSQGTKSRSQEDADVPNVNGEVKIMEDIVDDPARRHQTRVDSSSYYTTQRIPCGRIKPVPKFLHNDEPVITIGIVEYILT